AAEQILDVADVDVEAALESAARLLGRSAVAVVGGAPLRIAQDLVRGVDGLEPIVRVRIVRIAIRMVLRRELAERRLDLFRGRAPRDAEDLVRITQGFGHRSQPPPPASPESSAAEVSGSESPPPESVPPSPPHALGSVRAPKTQGLFAKSLHVV